MKTLTNNQKTKYTKYREILKKQNIILNELKEIKTKMMILGSLRHFEDLAKKGRQFAKKRGIKLSDVLKND